MLRKRRSRGVVFGLWPWVFGLGFLVIVLWSLTLGFGFALWSFVLAVKHDKYS